MKNSRFIAFLRTLTGMSDYIDIKGASDSIRENIYFRGPNVVILACAIIIASVGLNVNSIPVIIGAMLISPVMGPILGFGFGLGTRDNQLVKDSLKNFAIMVSISIVASTLYFLLSPLNLLNPTELAARTNPTLYDVLIALFGGIAGILETSRKKKGTVLAGVAIATALMPPLCTVGYGISILSIKVIAGAFYLFLINGIFISLATFVSVKYLRFPVVSSQEQKLVMSARALSAILILIIVPSVLTAISVVKDNNFKIHVSKLVDDNKSIGGGFIYDYRIDNTSKPASVEFFMAGEALNDSQKEIFYTKAEMYGIMRNQIIFKDDAAINRKDISDTEIIRGIYEHSESQIKELEDSIKVLNSKLAGFTETDFPSAVAVSRELKAQVSEVSYVMLFRETTGLSDNADSAKLVLIVYSVRQLSSEQQKSIERWARVRLSSDDIIVIYNVMDSNQPIDSLRSWSGQVR